MFGTRAIGLRRRTARTSVDDVVGLDLLLVREARPLGHRVATNAGEIAVARTPCSASSRLSEFVNEMSAAFVAP